MERDPYTTRYYRLKAPVPLVVSFPSVVYRIEVRRVPGCPKWELSADSLAGSGAWRIMHGGSECAALLAVVYLEGFFVCHPTVPSTIMERLCREGRAERLSQGFAARFWEFYA